MSKKIDAASKSLIKALKKHSEVVGSDRVSLKKAERATAKLQEAAADYAEVVHAKTGLPTPFNLVVPSGLDSTTLHSLSLERDAISKSLTHPIPVQKAAKD
jgi:hypothetical protein